MYLHFQASGLSKSFVRELRATGTDLGSFEVDHPAAARAIVCAADDQTGLVGLQEDTVVKWATLEYSLAD